jgi:two-component system heavy metal sensor histidine kinase CusS
MAARQQAPLIVIAMIVRSMIQDLPSVRELESHPDLVDHILAGHLRMSLWIYGENGRLLLASARNNIPISEWAGMAQRGSAEIATKLWRAESKKTYRVAVTSFQSPRPEIGSGTIVLALDVSDWVQVLQSFRRSLFVLLPVAMLVMLFAGVVVTRRELRSITQIAESARRITPSELGKRLDVSGMPPELQPLTASFNEMLERLEQSFVKLSDFSADLAHELRTPLTSLLGRTQLVLARRRGADEYRESMEKSMDEIARMSRLVSDMLFLAQADHDQLALAHELIDLRKEVDRLLEFFSTAAEERGIRLEASGAATMYGDRRMLARSLSNILSNAIRHSPDGERVEVILARGDGVITVSVNDRGPGLSPQHAARVFDRFYRVDPSRGAELGGVGLGLAIARSIVRMHGGDISVESEPGKPTRFILCIPIRTVPPARRVHAAAPAALATAETFPAA